MGFCVQNEKYPPTGHGLLATKPETIKKNRGKNNDNNNKKRKKKMRKEYRENNSEKNTDAKKGAALLDVALANNSKRLNKMDKQQDLKKSSLHANKHNK